VGAVAGGVGGGGGGGGGGGRGGGVGGGGGGVGGGGGGGGAGYQKLESGFLPDQVSCYSCTGNPIRKAKRRKN